MTGPNACEVKPHSTPWIVYLANNGCAGTLISKRLVLTAAHCACPRALRRNGTECTNQTALPLANKHEWKAILGLHDTRNFGAGTLSRNLSAIIVHDKAYKLPGVNECSNTINILQNIIYKTIISRLVSTELFFTEIFPVNKLLGGYLPCDILFYCILAFLSCFVFHWIYHT